MFDPVGGFAGDLACGWGHYATGNITPKPRTISGRQRRTRDELLIRFRTHLHET
ncbi:hypothetical protein HMPREF0578_0854 [Mobiluncus mulieris 28-1]|nr:hypothetical protein HMPREF0578_0854 [Mobiluncus mulieris 28-1]